MGLGLPDGGHLTHGYYVCHCYIITSKLTHIPRTDRQEENHRFFNLLPISPLRPRRPDPPHRLRRPRETSAPLQAPFTRLRRVGVPP